MMKTSASVVVVLTLLLPARADADWFVKPFVGVKVASSSGFVDLEGTAGQPKLFVGGAFGWQWPRGLGLELDVATAPDYFKDTGDLVTVGRVSTMMGNITWMLPRPAPSSRIRGYISGGIGVVRVQFKDALEAFTSNSSLPAANAGGGAIIAVGPRVSVTADLRYFRSQDGEANRRGFEAEYVAFTRVSGGVLLRF